MKTNRQRMIMIATAALCACLAVGCGAKKSSQDGPASHDMTLMSYNVHETNRLASVEIIRKAVAERAATKPVYLTGDWNDTPPSKPLMAMRSFMTILFDTTKRTFHDFKPSGPVNAYCIDYIAVDSSSAKRIVVRDSHVVPDETTSDHSPVVASISVAAQ